MAATVKLGSGFLKELRIHLCQKSLGSLGIRQFVENDYVHLKKANKEFPILIRECSGISPRIYASAITGCVLTIMLQLWHLFLVLFIISFSVLRKKLHLNFDRGSIGFLSLRFSSVDIAFCGTGSISFNYRGALLQDALSRGMYGRGVEKKVSLDGVSREKVLSIIQDLAKENPL